MRCSDQIDRRILVKHGEDLRLDMRVEQLLHLMDVTLRTTPAAASKGLRLRTYAVHPLSEEVGIIEWVDGAVPLMAVLKQAQDRRLATRTGKGKAEDFAAEAMAAYGKFYPTTEAYLSKLDTADRQKVTQLYEHCVARVEPGLLRSALLDAAEGPEAFVAARSTLASSVAALSVACWVMGVGDRHLDNFLVSVTTGSLVAIDFGHTFGSATTLLPVPELVQCRLTPQILRALEPIPAAALLQRMMTVALEALRTQRASLLNALDIFVRDPTAEWVDAAVKASASTANQGVGQGARGSSKMAECVERGLAPAASAGLTRPPPARPPPKSRFLHRRVHIVEGKLAGAHPAHVTLDEVEESVSRTVRSKLSLEER